MGPGAHDGVRNNLYEDRKIKWRELHELEVQYEMLFNGAWPVGICVRHHSKT